MSRKIITAFAILFAAVALSAQIDIQLSNSDLWDVSQGTVVTSNSPMLSSFPGRNMFGDSVYGPSDALFSDSFDVGYVHYIEWQTPSPVTIQSFTLYAGHESWRSYAPNAGELTFQQRGFSEFRLFAFNDSTMQFDLVFDLAAGDPYGTTVLPHNAFTEDDVAGYLLLIGVNIDAVTADRFRAEFVQAGDRSSPGIDTAALGPRIYEIDGYGTIHPSTVVIPEPGTWAFLGLGALVLTGRQMRKRLQVLEAE